MTTPLQWPPGYRINPRAAGPDAAVVDAFKTMPVAAIGDAMSRNIGTVGLRQYHARLDTVLCGPAVTVRVRPGDNLMIHKALMMVEPGDVLVIDGGGDPNNALVGELIMLYALQRGCGGFVIDGAIRDVRAFFEADFPCYARSNTHRGPYKLGPGATNRDVTVGGQVVHPGDVIVGDEDGVVSFDPADGERLLAAIAQTARTEDAIKAEIATGRKEQAWLDRTLAAHGL